MGLAEDIAEIGRLIDAYHARNPWCAVVDEDDPPIEMRGEPLKSSDWVACRVLPSTLGLQDLITVETELGVQFPPMFRAYLLARFHLIDQVQASSHNRHQIFWPPVPSRDSFQPIRTHVRSWPSLLAAGYVPFAEWGDGWGPMCFDTHRRPPESECPVVWMDHERLFDVGVTRCRDRANVEPLAQALYESSRELILDVFTLPPSSHSSLLS